MSNSTMVSAYLSGININVDSDHTYFDSVEHIYKHTVRLGDIWDSKSQKINWSVFSARQIIQYYNSLGIKCSIYNTSKKLRSKSENITLSLSSSFPMPIGPQDKRTVDTINDLNRINKTWRFPTEDAICIERF